MTRDETIRTLAALKPQLLAKGVAHLALFGSRARGDNRPDSDIDVLIEVIDREQRRFTLLDLVSVGHVIEDRTGLSTSVVMRRSISADFAETVAEDVVEVF